MIETDESWQAVTVTSESESQSLSSAIEIDHDCRQSVGDRDVDRPCTKVATKNFWI